MRSGAERVPSGSLLCALLGFLALAVIGASEAAAAFPGKPGRIAYSRTVGAQSDVFTMRADGSDQRNITNTLSAYEAQPSYSADGRRIVFLKFDGEYELWIMNADGGGKTQLTATPGVQESSPGFSPNGKRVVFARGFGTGAEIYAMSATPGAPAVNLSNSPSTGDFEPEFSPDGRRIVYSSATSISELFLMNANGSGQVNITNTVETESAATFSPDGRQLLFTRFIGSNGEVFRGRTDGTGFLNLTNDPASESGAAFSPDGTRALFARDTGGIPGGRDNVFSIPLRGGSPSQLTAFPTDQSLEGLDWQPIPVKCGGKRSTLVGTPGKDKLIGTKGRDVISSLGGRDRLNGKGGNDILCGNGGDDRLLAGGGKKDRCIGAKGADSSKGCEANKGV